MTSADLPESRPARVGVGLPAALVIALVFTLGLAVQVAIRLQDLARDPLARAPRVDALHFWRWGGRIADGQCVGDEPFFSAPLYPYLVGLVRALGGGLEALVWLQVGLLALATVLAARAAAGLVRHAGGSAAAAFGAAALAAGLLWFTPDVAQAPGRVLAGTLQVLLVALACERAVAFVARPDLRRGAGLGASAGVLCLAWPPALGALPLVALWAAWVAGRGEGSHVSDAARPGVLRALVRGQRVGGVLLGIGCLAIAPATVHNWMACGEPIPITAHGGLTFFHGNNPGADGVITGSGLSMDKARQGHEALALTREALGEDAGWGDVSGHFLGRGLDWWRDEPARAARLAAFKAWLFLSGRHYGDIYLPALEREAVLPRLGWAFLPAPAWVLAGLVAGFVLLWTAGPRARAASLPVALLALVPFAVVTVFWYTPRYRLPALPALAVLLGAALALAVQAWRARDGAGQGADDGAGHGGHPTDPSAPLRPGLASLGALVAALGVGLGSGPLNAAVEVDDQGPRRAAHDLALAEAFAELGRTDEARTFARRALDGGHPPAARLLAELEGGAAGLEALRQLAAARPGDPDAQRSLAVALARTGQTGPALEFFRRACDLDASDWQARQGLAAALFQLDRAEDARAPIAEALVLAPDEPDVRYTAALVRLGTGDEAGALEELRATLDLDRAHGPARGLTIQLLRGGGDDAGAVEVMADWLARDPRDAPQRPSLTLLLAWVLATSPQDAARDGARALEVLAPLADGPGAATDVEYLDTLAAARAEAGDLAGALEALRRAEAAARDGGAPPDQLAALAARRASYEAGRPWRDRP